MPLKCDVFKEEPRDVSMDKEKSFKHIKTEPVDVGQDITNNNFVGVPHDSVFISQHLKPEGTDDKTTIPYLHVPEGSDLISRSTNHEDVTRQMKHKDVRDENDNCCFLLDQRVSDSVPKFVSNKATLKESNSSNDGDIKLNIEEVNPVLFADLRRFCCDYCKRKFKRKAHLKLHLRIHTGEKPYKCDECDAKFAYRSVLRYHKYIHSGEKPFECDICGARFTKKFNLESHQSRKHTRGAKVEPVEKKFNCNMCKSKFVRLSALKLHERKHSSDRPFKCTSCEKKFKYNHVLKKHLKIHAVKNSFKKECDIS
ncbi:zinc finger protein 69 homolog [Planococcus citri]|uniref:zinc finger protein 69 homolog n=1 Tax=Planococcus citri TaxID=170843 RepID=UPI0031F7A1DA